MKIIFEKNVLLNAINAAMCAVSGKNTKIETEGILIKDEGADSCCISSYDLEKGFRTVISADVREGGCFIINAVRINQIVKVMPEGELTLEISDKNIVTLTSQNSCFELSAISGESFPKLPELNIESGSEIMTSELRELLTKTMFAMGINDSRIMLNGVFLKQNDNVITVVACDGNRLAYADKKFENPFDVKFSFIIPAKTVNELVRLLPDSDEKLSIALGRKHVIFRFCGMLFFSRLIDSEYIDYERFIPSSNKITATMNRGLLLDSLERASLISEDKTLGQIKSGVKMKFSENYLDITSVSVSGRVFERIQTKKSGDDINICFNCRFLLDALRSCDAEVLNFGMSSPLMGVMITDAGEDETGKFIYIVLPLNIKE